MFFCNLFVFFFFFCESVWTDYLAGHKCNMWICIPFTGSSIYLWLVYVQSPASVLTDLLWAGPDWFTPVCGSAVVVAAAQWVLAEGIHLLVRHHDSCLSAHGCRLPREIPEWVLLNSSQYIAAAVWCIGYVWPLLWLLRVSVFQRKTCCVYFLCFM